MIVACPLSLTCCLLGCEWQSVSSSQSSVYILWRRMPLANLWPQLDNMFVWIFRFTKLREQLNWWAQFENPSVEVIFCTTRLTHYFFFFFFSLAQGSLSNITHFYWCNQYGRFCTWRFWKKCLSALAVCITLVSPPGSKVCVSHVMFMSAGLVQLVQLVWNELCSPSQPPPHAAAVTGVSYSVWDTQSSHGCPCKKRLRHTELNKHTTYVSYSAVNISVTARNAAGDSPQAVIPVLPVSTAGLKSMCSDVSQTTCFYPLVEL